MEDDALGVFKVVLIFDLEAGQADEELRRSGEAESMPSRLRRQPGFIGMELVKVSEDQTMSIGTWRSASDWWAALEAVKVTSAEGREARPSILVSRAFHGGVVAAELGPAA